MSVLMDYFIIFWGFLMIGTMAIGGFFMFRKFLKQLPKQDGKSDMDWEIYYMDKTKHMWKQEEKDFLEDLVSPVPELFRDVARHKIASKIGEIALKQNKQKISRDNVIEGILLLPQNEIIVFLRKKLAEKHIDTSPYEPLFQASKADYEENWQDRYKNKSNT